MKKIAHSFFSVLITKFYGGHNFYNLFSVVEAPKPAARQEVRIADQIAIRSYVLGKNIAKTGETISIISDSLC